MRYLRRMVKLNASAVLAVVTLAACSPQAIQSTSIGNNGAILSPALGPDAGGPIVYPTRLYFKSPKAHPRKVYVGPKAGAIGENCTSRHVMSLSRPVIGKYHLLVYTVTPHAVGSCTVDFYLKNSKRYTRLHVTVHA